LRDQPSQDGESVTQILVVETDIEMAAGPSGYDAQTLDAIEMTAHRESRALAALTGCIRIVPIRYCSPFSST
jgi:hypothetical protein